MRGKLQRSVRPYHQAGTNREAGDHTRLSQAHRQLHEEHSRHNQRPEPPQGKPGLQGANPGGHQDHAGARQLWPDLGRGSDAPKDDLHNARRRRAAEPQARPRHYAGRRGQHQGDRARRALRSRGYVDSAVQVPADSGRPATGDRHCRVADRQHSGLRDGCPGPCSNTGEYFAAFTAQGHDA